MKKKGKKSKRKRWNLVADFDSVHDVEAKNASQNSAGDDPDVTPFLRSYHLLRLLFRRNSLPPKQTSQSVDPKCVSQFSCFFFPFFFREATVTGLPLSLWVT